MKILTTELIRKHIHLEDESENYLLDIGNRAENMIEKMLGYSFQEMKECHGEIPEQIVNACLILTCEIWLYRNKELKPKEIPYYLFHLLNDYSLKKRKKPIKGTSVLQISRIYERTYRKWLK